MNRLNSLPLPTQSGNRSPVLGLPRVRQTNFGRGGNVAASALALSNAGSFGLRSNAADLSTSPSVPTSSSYAAVGQAGSAGNVTPQGQQPGYTGDNYAVTPGGVSTPSGQTISWGVIAIGLVALYIVSR